MAEYITVATFNFVHEIAVLKSILEKEELSFFFQNENLISIDPFATIAYGGIHLKVHPSDVKKVKEILNNLNTRLTIVE